MRSVNNSAQILLTEPEAAERLRLCARVLRKARQDGRLHYVLIGRAVRYRVEDLESWIETLRKVEIACPPKRRPTRSSRPKRKSAEIVPFTARSCAG